MLPIKLKIAGLYSYISEQVIDFTQLSNAGLFGIFGEIGSGKSSILDAICFAIYQKTERLNISGDNRYYNMLNLNCDTASVEFEFQAGKDNTVYEVFYKLKRTKNNFEKVDLDHHLFYKIEAGEKITVTHQEIIDAIGLTYENFRRTIIIPQGKFKDFIELKGTDRSKMMKELFNLHRFDLYSDVKSLEDVTKAQRSVVEGELGAYRDVNQEIIQQLDLELVEINNSFAQLEEAVAVNRLKVTQLEELKIKLDNLVVKKNNLIIYEEKEKVDVKKEQEILVYEDLKSKFSNLFQEIDSLKMEIVSVKDRLELIKTKKENLELAQKTNEENLKEIEDKVKNTAVNKEKVADFDLIVMIKEEEQKKQEALENKTRLTPKIQSISDELNWNKEKKSNLEIEIEELKTKLLPEALVERIKYWFVQLGEKEQQKVTILNQKQVFETSSTEIESELSTFFDSELKSLFEHLPNGFSLEEFEQFYTSLIVSKENEINALREELNQLKVQQQLEQFSMNLVEGDPCDLCGSTHHPVPFSSSLSKELVEGIELKINELNELKSSLNSLYFTMKTGFSKKEDLKEKLRNCLNDFDRINSELDQLKLNAPSNQFTAADNESFTTFYQESIAINSLVIEKQTRVNEIVTLMGQAQNEKEQLQIELNQIDLFLSGVDATIQVHNQTIKHLKRSDFESLTNAELLTLKDNLIAEINSVDVRYNQLITEKQEIALQLSEQLTHFKVDSSQLNTLVQRMNDKHAELNEKLIQAGKSEVEVKAIIELNLNVLEIRNLINENRAVLNSLRGEVQLLETQIEGKVYDQAQYETLKTELNSANEKLTIATEKRGSLETRLVQLRQDLITKERLEREFADLSLRLTDLGSLLTLFKANRFVDFMSIRYLHNIIELANVRFQKMTKQQYKLLLHGKDNDLYIEDFLNGGKKRSLKSLGGGHTFQACLALALALSENIQKMAAIDQQFFFLDEGFGTLDKNALQLVFETLKSLKNENRVVGLISHVEELQQEMDVFLKINANQELGTVITESWN